MIWHHLKCDFSPCSVVIHLHLSLNPCFEGLVLYALNMSHCVCLHALACELSFQYVFGVIFPWYNSNFCWRSHTMLGLGRCSVILSYCPCRIHVLALHVSLFWLPSIHVLASFWHALGLFWVALAICIMYCIVIVQVPMLALSFENHSMLHLHCVHDLASFTMTFLSI